MNEQLMKETDRLETGGDCFWNPFICVVMAHVVRSISSQQAVISALIMMIIIIIIIVIIDYLWCPIL